MDWFKTVSYFVLATFLIEGIDFMVTKHFSFKENKNKQEIKIFTFVRIIDLLICVVLGYLLFK